MYVDPDELKQEVIVSKEDGRATERLGSMILLLSQRANRKFRGDDETESMIVFAMLRALPYIDCDQCGKGMFAYLTTVAANLVNKEKKRFRPVSLDAAIAAGANVLPIRAAARAIVGKNSTNDLIWRLRDEGKSMSEIADRLNELDRRAPGKTTNWNRYKVADALRPCNSLGESKETFNNRRPKMYPKETINLIVSLRQTMTLIDVADELNRLAVPTAIGRPWTDASVKWVEKTYLRPATFPLALGRTMLGTIPKHRKKSSYPQTTIDLVHELRDDGLSFAKIAVELNRLEVPMLRGERWGSGTAYKLMDYPRSIAK